MKNTLGLDLGSNSLGWAILDDITGDIVDKGVVVFPEGIDAANDTLQTPAAIRRAARMGRRMKFRRKLRKWNLLKILLQNRMCPLTEEELKEWKSSDKYPVGNKAFLDWLKSTDTTNPYCDRAACLDGKVDPFVLGRALYHICQRRGFKSSRKDAAPDTGDEAADRKAADKKLGKVKTDINQLSEAIRESGARTLGEYFYKLIESEKSSIVKTRVRARYTGRIEHYLTEFTAIMDAQGIAENSELRKELYKAIFMQRPLRSQKNLVGKCPLEPKSSRAMIGHPDYEEFRMLAFVNNLSFDDADGNRHPLTAQDRELVCGAFMKAAPNMKFGDISKLFKKDARFKNDGWKFHYYRDDETVATCSTRHRIRKNFGGIPYDEQTVFDALTFYNDDDLLRGWFTKHYPQLEDKSVNLLASIHPKEGNANYSLKAIRKILRFLRKGFELSQARFYAKLPDLIPNFESSAEQILLNMQEILIAYRKDKSEMANDTVRNTRKLTPLLDRYFEYLRDNWGFDETKWQKLYLRGDETYAVDPDKPNRLPVVKLGMIRNPLVQRSMTSLRRLVNYLFDHGKIDQETTIRIELARNVNDYATRRAIQEWQKSRERLRDDAKSEIEKLGVKVTEDAIERYLLCKEQNGICLYTGESIKLTDLLSGNKFDIEHTIPRSKSGDDSLANKTICEFKYNRQTKKGCIPRACPDWDEIEVRLRPWRDNLERLEKDFHNQNRAAKNAADPESHSRARIKALTTKLELDYWRDKIRRFDITEDRLTDPASGLSGFKKRQLVDTGIMCSHAVELLRSVYPATFAVNGTATAFARKAWGIQSDEAKDRTEHTHHAKDAMVIAALTPSRFNAICAALKDDGTDAYRRPCDVCPPPWPDFAEKVRKATGEILVKHVLRQTTLRQSSKRNALAKTRTLADGTKLKYVLSRGDTVRNSLHDDTIYGSIHDPHTNKFFYAVRKSIVGPITGKTGCEQFIDKIIDPVIKQIVIAKVAELKHNGINKIEAGDVKMPSGMPINRVRIYARIANPYKIRMNTFKSVNENKQFQYVSSSPNFRLALCKCNGKFTYETESSLSWSQSHKKEDYQPLENKDGFIGYVFPRSMAIACDDMTIDEIKSLPNNELRKRLYFIRVLPSESDNHAELQLHLEARPKKEISDKSSVICGKEPHSLIRTSAGRFMRDLLFENIHFKMNLDGTIVFRRR